MSNTANSVPAAFVCGPGPRLSWKYNGHGSCESFPLERRPSTHRWCMKTAASAPRFVTDAVKPSALSEGIKAVAVGKFGNKSVSTELAEEIKRELKYLEEKGSTEETLFLQRSSFLGSLFAKASLEPQEEALLGICRRASTRHFSSGVDRGPSSCTAGELIAYITGSESCEDGLTSNLIHYGLKLLNGIRLDEEEAEELGDLLFSLEKGRSALSLRCLIAHVMRVRHESREELIGLARAARNTLNSEFKTDVHLRPLSMQSTALIAEPFDGVTKCSLLTPVIAHHLQTKYSLLPLLSCGDTPGPKYGVNLKTLAQVLEIPTVTTLDMLKTPVGMHPFGLVLDQAKISSALAAWVHLRRAIIKRPALATVEKYMDIVPGDGSEVFISSAFHANYVDRMVAIAEAVGFRKYVIVRKGVEGTLGLRAGHRTKGAVNVGVRKGDRYVRQIFEWGSGEAGVDLEVMRRRTEKEVEDQEKSEVEKNAILVKRWIDRGESGSAEFDTRVKMTIGMLDHAMECIEDLEGRAENA